MAYDKFERSFPCPCGNGQVIAEWEEHDTWPGSNRYPTYKLCCDECAQHLCISYVKGRVCLLPREDDEKKRRYEQDISELERSMGELATSGYLEEWRKHIKSLPSKAAMCRAMFYSGTEGTFRRNVRTESELERAIEDALRFRPKRCLAGIGIEDSDLNASARRLAQLREKEAAFTASLMVIEVPKV